MWQLVAVYKEKEILSADESAAKRLGYTLRDKQTSNVKLLLASCVAETRSYRYLVQHTVTMHRWIAY